MTVDEAIDKLSKMGNCEVDIIVNITVLKSVTPRGKLSLKAKTIEFYEETISEVLGVNKDAFKANNRKFEGVRARCILFKLLITNERLIFTYAEIGRIYNKDHSTVIHSVKVVFEDLYETNKIFKNQFDNIKSKISIIE